jgi:hypothetical protein
MTTENATQSGAFESGSSARSNALAQIAKQVHEQNAGDFRSFNEETGEISQEPVKEVKAEPEQQQPAETPPVQQEQQQEQQPQAETLADDGLEVLVIDGQERRVKREQVLEAGKRTLQKEAAADKRLEEAGELLRRVKAMEQAILQRQPSSDAGGESEQPASTDPANGTATPQARATPDIGTLVDERLWMRDADKAAQRFKEEFKDIVDDPYAARLVAQLENERLAKLAEEGKPVTAGDPWEAYQAHGTKVREWLGKAKPAGQVQVPADKAERKRDTVTVTGSTTSRPAPTQPKPLTTSEQIEQMRKARQGRQIQPTR